ncbi:MAG: DNA gyrase subunit B, partial [Oscillospiraceae bacterium]|nr:DNA gyrase subunit B [Oscillospiraceae bacterium]
MSDETKVTQEYGAEQIQVLEGLEAVRKRPGMYIGSTSVSGLHHLVYEIVDNSIDEALAGYCKHITVTINKGDSITVTDDGRGIPVDIQAQTGKPALEVVFTVLHAGGKFGGGGYKVSGGLHGVGASVVNALSEWLRVRVYKNGNIYEMKFARGHITQEMTIVGKTDKTGTEVTFQPDPEMFDTLVYDYETLHTRMREKAFLTAGLTISITDDRGEEPMGETMCYEGGIREFVTWCNRNKTPIHPDVIYMNGSRGDASAEVAVQYNDGYNEFILSFANEVNTPEGGMHETGFRTALTRVLNNYGVKNGIIKGDDKVTGEDCREGITAIISVKLTDAQFEGQTKAKLGNAYIRTLVDQIVSDQLSTYFEEHPATAKIILEKAMMANRAREAARKARESIRRKTGLESGQMPDKLQDCNERDPSLCEIYIVEGDSAAGSAIQGRDSRFQAILAMWGKMLNVEKARADKIYGNDKLYPLIVALGAGIGEDFDIEKLRYHKVIIMSDA